VRRALLQKAPRVWFLGLAKTQGHRRVARKIGKENETEGEEALDLPGEKRRGEDISCVLDFHDTPLVIAFIHLFAVIVRCQ
jgi:hypothetical protein